MDNQELALISQAKAEGGSEGNWQEFSRMPEWAREYAAENPAREVAFPADHFLTELKSFLFSWTWDVN